MAGGIFSFTNDILALLSVFLALTTSRYLGLTGSQTMPSLSAIRAANAAFQPSYRPVALFVGGTSGIGQAMAEAFANHTQGNAHIIICGRDKSKADTIIQSLPKAETSTYEFVPCDVSLMKNVQACTDSLVQRIPKLNFLVLSPGILTMQGRTETTEGIDVKLALHYYGRWKFADGMLPSLIKAKEEGEEARVLSVLASGKGGPINLEDLDLKKKYSLRAAADHATTGTDIIVTEYAHRYPQLSFIHTYPGFVNTPLITRDKPIMGTLMGPLARLLGVKPEDCAEYMLYPLLSKECEKGAFFRDNHGNEVKKNKYVTDETRKKVWEHTVEITQVQ